MITKNACNAMYKIAEESAKIGTFVGQYRYPTSYFGQLLNRQKKLETPVKLEPFDETVIAESLANGYHDNDDIPLKFLDSYRDKQAKYKAGKYFPRGTPQYESAVKYFKDQGVNNYQSYIKTGKPGTPSTKMPDNIPSEHYNNMQLDALDMAYNRKYDGTVNG